VPAYVIDSPKRAHSARPFSARGDFKSFLHGMPLNDGDVRITPKAKKP
jgi:hypothetical protein